MSRKTRRKQKRKKTPAAQQQKKASLTWSVNPSSESFGKSMFAVVMLLVMAALTYWLLEDVDRTFAAVGALIAMIIMFLMLSRFFLSTHYLLDDEGFQIKNGLTRKRLHWEDFKAFRHNESALMLSPFESPSRLRSLRAVLLLLDRERREEILDFVRSKVAVDETAGTDTE